MKEKRVDIYLAKAGFCQLMLIGFGSAFLNEIIQDEPRMIVLFPGGLFSMAFASAIVNFYIKAKTLTRKTKK